jgi:hypothetical protein
MLFIWDFGMPMSDQQIIALRFAMLNENRFFFPELCPPDQAKRHRQSVQTESRN